MSCFRPKFTDLLDTYYIMCIILSMRLSELKSLRTAKGYTQYELAEKAGVSLPTIQNIEAGRANPSLSNIELILGALDARLEIKINLQSFDLLDLFNMDLERFKKIDLKKMLLQFFESAKEKPFQDRDLDLMAALLSGLSAHYPLWMKQQKFDSATLKKWHLLEKKIDPSRLIKFRRIWVAKISQVI